jgi:hypothetical protein
MELQVFDVEQGTEEWLRARLGIPTASEFQCLLAKGRGPGGESVGRTTYLRKLAGERITGLPSESYSNDHMERGKAMEQEARDTYAFLRDVEPHQVGFLRRGDVGCSPDSLIGDVGLVEIKTKLPHLQIAVLEEGKVPAEHIAQLQGQLWVSGRQWVDFVSYWPGLPPFIQRVPRDEIYIATLKVAVDGFLADLNALVERITNYRAAA